MNSPDHVAVPCDLCGASPGKPFMKKFGLWYTCCETCGFVYANPRSVDPSVYNREHNEDLLQKYAATHYSTKKQDSFRRRLRSLSRYRTHGRILEIGCNVGGFLYQAGNMGWEPVGVEPVASVAAYGEDNYGLDIRVCTLEQASFPDNYFDAIFNNAVLEHVPSPSSVLREAFRVLRPGGVIFIDTVNIDSYTWRNVGEAWKLVDQRAHLSLFSPDTLNRFCTDAGLQVLKIGTHGVRFRPNKGPASRPCKK